MLNRVVQLNLQRGRVKGLAVEWRGGGGTDLIIHQSLSIGGGRKAFLDRNLDSRSFFLVHSAPSPLAKQLPWLDTVRFESLLWLTAGLQGSTSLHGRGSRQDRTLHQSLDILD